MDRAALLVTDSGGLQEEGPSFGKPILITRNVTERPEVLECGGVLVGTDPKLLGEALTRALDVSETAPGQPLRVTPFGDGRAGIGSRNS
jgi:UDP-N-acetylglucosamine 2-epimerase (non-hydrolysing)